MLRLNNEQYSQLRQLLGHDPQIDGQWALTAHNGPIKYAINSKGTLVVRLQSTDKAGRNQNPRICTIKEYPDHYLYCCLNDICIRLHRIMAEAWLDDFDPSLTVNHKNGDTHDNDIHNLEMMTVRDNCLHYHHSEIMKERRENDYAHHATTMRGRIHITNGTQCKMIYESDGIPEGWYRGRPDSMKDKVSKSRKGISAHNKDKQAITDGIHNKYISLNEPLPEGWRPGCTVTISDELKEFRKQIISGRIYIHKGTTNKRIYPEQLAHYLSQGWVKGMYSRRSSNP